MAVQIHVVHSSFIEGAGILAGPPFYCAIDNILSATTSCMTGTPSIHVGQLVTWTERAADMGYLDSVQNLENLPIYLASGGLDTVVTQKVMTATEHFYIDIGVDPSFIQTMFTIPAEHGWMTTDLGGPCDEINTKLC